MSRTNDWGTGEAERRRSRTGSGTDVAHDPLCPNLPCTCEPDGYGHLPGCGQVCQCSLIAKVRGEYVNLNCTWSVGECIPGCPSCKRMDDFLEERAAGYRDGISDCLEKLGDRLHQPPCDCAQCAAFVVLVRDFAALLGATSGPLLDGTTSVDEIVRREPVVAIGQDEFYALVRSLYVALEVSMLVPDVPHEQFLAFHSLFERLVEDGQRLGWFESRTGVERSVTEMLSPHYPYVCGEQVCELADEFMTMREMTAHWQSHTRDGA